MSRWKIRNRKTDYGTIILHWTLVVSLVVALCGAQAHCPAAAFPAQY